MSEPVVGEPEIVVVADPEDGAVEAAARIATILSGAITARGRADWATTGGSTPVAIYRRLAAPPLLDAVEWADVHLWWGDDRYVPRDHPLSNVKPCDDVFLIGVPIPFDHVHPFPVGAAIAEGRGAAWSAAVMAAELRRARLQEADGWPMLDLVLLGVGPDGHVLSVFPGSAAFDSTDLALAIPAPTHIRPHIERVTLNPALVGAARGVLVVANGADKAPVIAEVLGPERDPRRWPAQLARREGATWILDAAAASALPDR
jgi:6-phosphogluconolactonase